MQQSAKDIWKRILDEAGQKLPDKVVRAWLEPTEAVALEDDRLVIAVPDEFAAKWNETNHGALLSRLAESVAGKPVTVTFRVQEDRQRRPQMDFFVSPPSGGHASVASNPSNQPLNERYSFDSFVIGKSNQLAAAAAHAAVEAPGKTYNPLFI